MSNSIKDLRDYDLIKKCCRCESICLKSNFYMSENVSDGLQPQCKFCAKKYYTENRDKVKKYDLDIRNRIKNIN